MQIARTDYLITDRLITQTRRPKLGLDGEISFHREWSQRHDLRRVGLSRERHPRRVRSFALNGGNLAHPTRFERVTFSLGRQHSSRRGLRGREPEFAVGEKLKKRSLEATISCSSY